MATRSLGTALIILLIPASISCSLFTSAPEPSQADIEKEEQAVYSVFMEKGPGPTLILQMTSTNIAGQEPREIRDHIEGSFEDVSNNTVDSYIHRNAQPSQLSPDMDLGVEYELLSTEELAQITGQPNSPGYFMFSRVGFNNTLDQAVVYVARVAGPLAGSGWYYLMEKKDGEWTVKDEVMVWIS